MTIAGRGPQQADSQRRGPMRGKSGGALLLGLLSAPLASAPLQAAPMQLRVAPLLQRDAIQRRCPEIVMVSETLQPPREGSYGTDGRASLPDLASGWRLAHRDAFSASWTARVRPAFATCRAAAGIERYDGIPYPGPGHLRLRLWDGEARLTLEMSGMRDPNGYTPQITRAAVSADAPVWSWAGSD